MKFIKSVIQEMHDVTWPNGRQLRKDASSVIGLSVFFVGFFALVDWLVQIFLGLFQ
ncbi:preprotein translocase subunit SecE [Pediococcus ethanolidurans]|uniref:Preprotein translocase subunit SecE n=1 Tax=Pediococcus ethanolidurans TaxID=319653 RepID=A0A0R2JZP9_9LACO|nr:preprotein translocase subunit SecE [Pediococcus ethanolidurans]KRN82769.1 hypothetical protein IV87_GL001944 [Pediococcus ethanolidurans]MDV7719803.1 preprotein translocase subunit SecE [Pediococcus ethanolidurans]GEN94809.1 preprotein translocase subunit SecE [Pediococcus ethanolidurans]SER41386.1 preprotein translocase subunit SecE [Pediococcus ethanolidurans]